jgi:hypothetical protein
MKGALWFAIAVLCAIMYYNGVDAAEEKYRLERPRYEWIRCNCENGTELGLTTDHFIKMQMYVAGLEHEYERCSR